MRDFKFRVWDGERMKPVILWGFSEGFIMTSKYSSDEEEFKVMQYTGLKDKNGKEIYEGDILKDDYGPGEVKWIQEHCAFVVFSRGESSQYNFLESDGQLKYSEVIGNVFDMPDWDF
jgi:uncharacterized phage protein (TIGR01671 family)